jgi:ankyrin repeat protein
MKTADGRRLRAGLIIGAILQTFIWIASLPVQAGAPPEQLLHAISAGKLPILQTWVEQHPDDINNYVDNTKTLLLQAASSGHPELVDFLLKHGADPNLSGDTLSSAGSERTALHVAAANGQAQMVEQLLKAKADVKARDFNLQTPLHLGVLSEKGDIIRLLVKAGAPIHATDRNHITPYVQALNSGKTNLAMLLLLNVTNLDVTNREGNTPLHLASRDGDDITVAHLLARKAKVDAKNIAGITPLLLALEQNRMGIVQQLTNQGAKLDLFSAAGLGKAEEVRQILQQQPALLQSTNGQGRTALHWAAMRGQAAIVTNLLLLMVNVDQKDQTGSTALDMAALNGHEKVVKQLLAAKAKATVYPGVQGANMAVVKLLLAAGGSINETNDSGQTALHLAVHGGNPEMIKLLLTQGANVNAKDSKGRTPLDLAVKRGDEAATNLLLEAGNKPGTKNKNQGTPLHTAIANHNLKVLPDLVKGGAELETRDAQGRTPLLLALSNNNIEAMDILLKLGADIQATNHEGLSPLHLAVRYCFDWDNEDAFPGNTDDQPIWVKWGNRTGMYLLSKKADLNATNMLGQTPFHMVGLRGEVGSRPSPYINALVTNLLAHGGDINRRDAAGMTPLHLAVRTQSYPLVHALISHGADPNLKDNEGRTALHEALDGKKEDRKAMMRATLNTGGINRPATITMPRLQPFWRPNPLIIQILLKHKAAPNEPDNQGKTPWQMAIDQQDGVLIELLKEYGGK